MVEAYIPLMETQTRQPWNNLKQPRVRNEKHLKFIRSLCCASCHVHPCEAAHIRKGTDGGMSLKPSDIYVVPLCHACHATQHQIGEEKFHGDIARAISLAKYLYSVSGDAVLAFRAVMGHRSHA